MGQDRCIVEDVVPSQCIFEVTDGVLKAQQFLYGLESQHDLVDDVYPQQFLVDRMIRTQPVVWALLPQ